MSEYTPPRAFRLRGPSLCLVAALACAGLAFGAKLMLIGKYGTDIPFWDEWDAVGDVLLTPRAHGDLHAANFFIHHNEHRIVFTRLLSYALAVGNNQWDAMLEMTVNAAIHAGFCAALVMLAGRFLTGARLAAMALITTALFCAAFDWENTLQGFQSQFYFLEWGALGMFVFCAPAVPLSRRWWIGWLCGLASLVAMASGFLAAAALIVLLALRAASERRWERRDTLAAAMLGVLCVGGLLLNTHVAGHDRYKAHSPSEWLVGVEKLLSWPLPEFPAAFLLVQAPMVVLMAKRIRARNLRGGENMLMALAFWSWLQIAALSYGRVNYGVGSPRYTDLLAVGAFASGVALFLVWKESKKGIVAGIAGIAWIFLFAVGIWRQDHYARASVLAQFPAIKSAERRHLTAFLADGNADEIETAPANELPYPSPERLVEFLSEPGIKAMLPVGIRSPLMLVTDAETSGFSVADPGRLPPEHEGRAWFAVAGPAKLVSQKFSAGDLPYFHVRFCGSPDLDGTVIRIESLDGDESGPRNPLSADHWQTVDFSVSRDTPSRLVVDIPAGNHWFAFTEPVELGRLSWANRWLLRRAAWMAALSGMILAAALMAIAVRPAAAARPRGP
jgi:hypothetical protein